MTSKLVISFDFELGWGDLDSDIWLRREKAGVYDELRRVMPKLLTELKSREVPTTWAIVSNMLIENENSIATDYLPEGYRKAVRDFLSISKVSSKSALDLVGGLTKNAKVFEICSHTASHINARYPQLSSDAFVEDIRLSFAELERLSGNRVESIVFPRDYADYHLQVAQAFPMNFRLNPNFFYRPGTIFRLLRGAAKFASKLPPSHVYLGSMGETYQTGSMYYNWIGGRYTGIKRLLFFRNRNQLIRELSKGKGTYHVWLHPCDFAENELLYDAFLELLRNTTVLRDKGVLEVLTMSEVGRLCQPPER